MSDKEQTNDEQYAVDLTPDQIQQPDPNLVKAVREQIIQQMASEKHAAEVVEAARREDEAKAHLEYTVKMRASSDPWVEVLGTVQTEDGLRIELDWNDAFVEYLKANGIAGIDEDQVIQRYITYLLRDMTERMSEEAPEDSDYS